jgi:dihydrofolate reductase
VGKTIMGVAAVSLDGFIADDNDGVGSLFDWLTSGDVSWSVPGSDDEARSTRASADFMTTLYANTAANVIGRRQRLGRQAGRIRACPRRHPPFADRLGARRHGTITFVDGVEQAIAAAKKFAGDRDVDVAAGQIGGQALALGLIDQVVVNIVPVVFGSGRPFFGTGSLAEPVLLENPMTIVQGDRMTHLVYDLSR